MLPLNQHTYTFNPPSNSTFLQPHVGLTQSNQLCIKNNTIVINVPIQVLMHMFLMYQLVHTQISHNHCKLYQLVFHFFIRGWWHHWWTMPCQLVMTSSAGHDVTQALEGQGQGWSIGYHNDPSHSKDKSEWYSSDHLRLRCFFHMWVELGLRHTICKHRLLHQVFFSNTHISMIKVSVFFTNYISSEYLICRYILCIVFFLFCW